MNRYIIILAAVLLVVTGLRPAEARDAHFLLHNTSSSKTIVAFQTFEGGEWNTWEDLQPVRPGETITMTWPGGSVDECKFDYRITTLSDTQGSDTRQAEIDWCQVTDMYLTDDQMPSFE